MSIVQGLYTVYLPQIRHTILSNHVTFNDNLYLMANAKEEIVYVGDGRTLYANKMDEEDSAISRSQPYLPTRDPTLTDQNRNGKQLKKFKSVRWSNRIDK